MSYVYNGAGDSLDGAFTSSYNGEAITIACYINVADHLGVTTTILMLGNNSGSQNDAHSLKTVTVDNRWAAQSVDTAGSTDSAVETINVDGIWTGLVGTFVSDSSRVIYVGAIGNTGSSSTSRAVADALKNIRVGRQLGGAQVFTGKIAEVAMWNAVLDSGQITSYLAGTAASSIAPANLIGYWPLSADSPTHTNLGIDAGGTLTVTGAVFDADHPSIATGGSNIAVKARYYQSMVFD